LLKGAYLVKQVIITPLTPAAALDHFLILSNKLTPKNIILFYYINQPVVFWQFSCNLIDSEDEVNQSSVIAMNDQKIITNTREQEKEINNILIASSLYLGMSPAERQKLLHYLVTSYFNLLPLENTRALPTAIQTGSAM
jgi:hypothetical protein